MNSGQGGFRKLQERHKARRRRLELRSRSGPPCLFKGRDGEHQPRDQPGVQADEGAGGGKKKGTEGAINFAPSRVFKRTTKRKKIAEWLERMVDGFICQTILGILLIGECGGRGGEGRGGKR